MLNDISVTHYAQNYAGVIGGSLLGTRLLCLYFYLLAMLCCSAQKFDLLCSRIRVVFNLLHYLHNNLHETAVDNF